MYKKVIKKRKKLYFRHLKGAGTRTAPCFSPLPGHTAMPDTAKYSGFRDLFKKKSIRLKFPQHRQALCRFF